MSLLVNSNTIGAGAEEARGHSGGGALREIYDVNAQVVSVAVVPGEVYRAKLVAPEIARAARPLQFVNVEVSQGPHPFLRRPFSLSWFSAAEGLVEITWAVVGEGSKIMTQWETGTEVRVLGPLGNGFSLKDIKGEALQNADRPRLWLVGGGTGLLPMYPLAKEAASQGWEVALFYGARSMAQVMDTSRFVKAGCRVIVATEDGTYGSRGRVTDLLEPVIPELGHEDVIVACGPVPMLRSVKNLMALSAAPLYVSLESRMACGTGLCKGCAVRAAGDEEKYYHVCSDGPVFRADQVELGGAP